MNFEKIIDFLKDKISTFLEIYKRLFSLFMVKVFNPLRTKIDYFQCKYLHKGQLKKFVIIRYIVKELTLYFLVCFLFFFMIFFVNQILLLAEQILKQRVPFADVARLMLYCLPGVISQSAPFATLVGFLMCLGRLMSDNEILIFRASGQSYKLVLIPVLVLGMVISIISFFVNDYLLPVGNMKFSKLKREIAVANPTIEIESNSIKRLKNSTIIIGDVNDKEVSDIVFFDKGSDGNQRIVVAGKSEIQNAQKEGVIMHMNMNDAVVTLLDRKNKKNFDVLDSKTATLNVFDSAVFTNTASVSPREMTSYDLGKRIKNLEKSKNASKRQLNNYKMEYNKKFAMPFGSIFFAMLALPLAFLFGKHNGQTIGLIIGLFICLLYWAMMIMGQIFAARTGWSGFWTMWAPNLLIGGLGIIFYIVLKKR